jgi:hypothetical protein
MAYDTDRILDGLDCHGKHLAILDINNIDIYRTCVHDLRINLIHDSFLS